MSGAADEWEFVTSATLLPGVVNSAVGYRSTAAEPRLHRGLPAPSLTVVLSLDEPVVAGHSPEHAHGPYAYRNDVVVAGLHTTPAYIAQPRQQTGIQLAVHPRASRALFGVPAAELAMLTNEGTDVLGSGVTQLRTRLAETVGWQQRFALVRDYLRRCLDGRVAPGPPRPEVVEAWKWLDRHRGSAPIAELARHVMLSERQLTTLFRAEFGLTPKAVARLLRFDQARQHVGELATSNAERDLASIAHDCGYYDHSHLVRDFRQYTGTSPTGWLTAERRNIQAGVARAG